MPEVQVTQLIITCEACGNVYRYSVRSEQESEKIFENFWCENNCGRNLYSFITLGTLRREVEPTSASLQPAHAAR